MSFICHIHNYTEYNEEWNVFSAFNPSKCTHLEQWAADSATGDPGHSPGARGTVVDFLSEPGFEPTTLGYLGFQVQRSIH